MKRAERPGRIGRGEAGFSFIEIAVALIIIGMLTGAGLLLLGKTVESTQRQETLQRLQEAKSSLLLYAENRGSLPVEKEYFPIYVSWSYYYQKIGAIPVDAWRNKVRYVVAPHVIPPTLQLDICRRLKTPSLAPTWIGLNDVIEGKTYPVDGSGGREGTIAALLLSSGAKDADGDGDTTYGLFDGVNRAAVSLYDASLSVAGPYLRTYPSETFDDMVVTITVDELNSVIEKNFCTVTVEVTDSRSAAFLAAPDNSGIFSVYNQSVDPTKPLGAANPGSASLKILAPLGDLLSIKNPIGTLTFTVGSSVAPKISAAVSDTRTPAVVPPLAPTMAVKIVEVAPQ